MGGGNYKGRVDRPAHKLKSSFGRCLGRAENRVPTEADPSSRQFSKKVKTYYRDDIVKKMGLANRHAE
jgi:hypothetical protein